MVGGRIDVECANISKIVSERGQCGGVACQRCRVTGDVYDASRAGFGDLPAYLRTAPARGGSSTTISGLAKSLRTLASVLATSPTRASTLSKWMALRLRCACLTAVLPPSTLSMRVRPALNVANGSVNRPEPEYKSHRHAEAAPSSSPCTKDITWPVNAIGA